jgi:hypothetical protein
MRLLTWRALFIRSYRWIASQHVIGLHLTQYTRVQNAFDDVASTIHQILPNGIRALRSIGRAVLADGVKTCVESV